jgi:hypothetical protein
MYYTIGDSRFSIAELNALGSKYASTYGHTTSDIIKQALDNQIFNAAEKGYLMLALLGRCKSETVPAEEFNWTEENYQRQPIQAAAGVAGVTYPTTQVIQISSLDHVSKDMLISYPTNEKGLIVNINQATNEITVQPLTGRTLPAVTNGDILNNLASVEADGADGFQQYSRIQFSKDWNYAQMFSSALHYDENEWVTLQRSGNFTNLLSRNYQNMIEQFNTGIENTLINGERGEVKTTSGKMTKLTQGFYPAMLAAGSYNASCTLATLKDAFEDVVLNTEKGAIGDTKYALMTPFMKRELAKAYGRSGGILASTGTFTSWNPKDEGMANLNLDMIKGLSASNIVILPYQRLENDASLPASFRNRIMLLDFNMMTKAVFIDVKTGGSLDRSSGIPKNYKDYWVTGTLGWKFHDLLRNAYIDVTV